MILKAISSLGRFCQWLEQTPPSQFIQNASWVAPTVQTIHILAIAAVVGSALMVNLRLLGVLGGDQSIASVMQRFAPVIWWSLPILLATGVVMTPAETARMPDLVTPGHRSTTP